MTREEFEKLVEEEFPNAIPEQFRHRIKNVAFLVEDEPSRELRAQEGLRPNETLLGHYRGIPNTARGDIYGIGGALPDAITLFRIPIEEEAEELVAENDAQRVRDFSAEKSFSSRADALESPSDRHSLSPYEQAVRQVVRETIWHEIAHHLGMNERMVRARERERRAKE